MRGDESVRRIQTTATSTHQVRGIANEPVRAYIRGMSTSTPLQSRQLGSDGPSVSSPSFDVSPARKALRPSQLAIAWVLARGKNIVPVIGARARAQLAGSLG